MYVIAIANQKGGVGKTTTAVNLGAGLAQLGNKVLVVDLDAQGNATFVLHRRLDEDEIGVCEVLLGELPITDSVVETSVENLFLAPAGESLANADLNLANMIGREMVLKSSLAKAKEEDFDYVLIDNPPYLGLLTINSLVAADYVIVPVSCEYLPLLGLKFLSKTIGKVKAKLHKDLKVMGYLLTMYDRREKITFTVEDTLREKFQELVFPNPIRINTKQKGAPSRSQTIFQYEHSESGKGTQDFMALTEEVVSRIKGGV